jgi:hypothetical protein
MHEHERSTPAPDSLLARLNDPTNTLSERQFRELRGKYFTVRHIPVSECGHKIDAMNEPTIGCEWCWWTWFSGHAELVQTTDKAFQEHGKEFVIKMRGRRYLKYFLRYMSTLARFQKEQEEKNEQSRDIQGGGAARETDGQDERGDNDLSTAGGQG